MNKERSIGGIVPSIEELSLEVDKKERAYRLAANGLVHSSEGRVSISEEFDLVDAIAHMERTIRRIASSEERAFKESTKSLRPREATYALTQLGKDIWEVCRVTVPLIEHIYFQSRKPAIFGRRNRVGELRPKFNAWITVMLHACQVAMPKIRWCPVATPLMEFKDVRTGFDHLICSVRRVCRSRRFKYLNNNYQRSAEERLKSARLYMVELFAECSKLLILRVDLYFLPEHKLWADSIEANKCFDRFFRALREGRIVPDVKGWLARQENGFRRGAHVHLLVAMDGHKHRNAVHWSKHLGDCWVDKVSRGKGSYFSCMALASFYKYNGLGLVHVSDSSKLLGVAKALEYLAKPYFQVGTKRVKDFRRGIITEPKTKLRVGAPRKEREGEDFVNKILGAD